MDFSNWILWRRKNEEIKQKRTVQAYNTRFLMRIHMHGETLFVGEYFIANGAVVLLFAAVHLHMDCFKRFVIVFATNVTIKFFTSRILFTVGWFMIIFNGFVHCFWFNRQMHTGMKSKIIENFPNFKMTSSLILKLQIAASIVYFYSLQTFCRIKCCVTRFTNVI